MVSVDGFTRKLEPFLLNLLLLANFNQRKRSCQSVFFFQPNNLFQMTPPDKSSTESRMHTLLADFKKSTEASDRARVFVEPTVSSQKIRRSILKNRERTSPRRDRPEDSPLKRVRFEPASGGPLKESVPFSPENSIASWSVSFIVAAPTSAPLSSY
ncbi:hypothetical protein PENNAL_c0122G11516 [Penicillium nalgiovense]|uniref:Uncharacterized protein n=1 Tax=Penicillium nalgiovense TaxID=60175 RepID=A0A1V6X524_PENNA|nr:hypothetical protein PENNAL_c0122G11516 [Penicillium nalgiovense]